MMLFKKYAILLLLIIFSKQSHCQDFNHPGVMHTKKDLDFVKSKIEINEQLWKNAYDKFVVTKAASYQGINPKPYASLEYQHHAYESVRCGSFNNPNLGCNDIVYDGMAAYSLALRFYFTDDIRYAQKAIEILDAWSLTYRKNEESNSRLVVSWAAPWYVNAGEILRYTKDSGWSPANTNRLNEMLNRFREYINWEEDGPVNNWTMSQIEARIAIAIFQNDRPYFNAAVEKWKRRIKTYIYQSSDGANPISPPGKTAAWTKRIWHDRDNRTGTLYVDGLCMETCRDISHSKLGFITLVNSAEMAWNQGIDLFEIEEKRIADFMELHANWMMGGNVPNDICDGYLDLVSEDGFEVAYNHIHDRLGRDLPRTLQMIDRNRPNGAARWLRKWETMMYADRPFRDNCVEEAPTQYTEVTDEGETVIVTKTVDIAYGACGTFRYLYEQNLDTPCTNEAFGGDPTPGRAKKCYIRTVNYPNIQFSTSHQPPNFAENLIDNDISDEKRWSAEGFPQTVVIDYGTVQSFSNVQIWSYQKRSYQYTISISNDPEIGFTDIVDRSSNTDTMQPFEDVFSTTQGRYIKITVSGAHAYEGSWVSLNEIVLSSNTLSLEEFVEEPRLIVYPNPSLNGIFNLTKKTEWTLYDLKGIAIQSGEGKQINISSLAKGMYLLKNTYQTSVIVNK